MAVFALVGLDNRVVDVVVADSEAQLLSDPRLHSGFRWVDTHGFGGIGYLCDVGSDAFIPQQPFASWVWSAEAREWVPPAPMPAGNPMSWRWDEPTLAWVESSLT